MAEWYVKELSRLTNVSVQTLHHYDRIGLLVPSIRQANGYRLYTEKDLLKLQQIIALKYFGFDLAQIKNLLAGEVNLQEHLTLQANYLAEKANTLFAASNALKKVVVNNAAENLIPWETTIKLIEVYQMTQELEKSWAKKALSPDEFSEYVEFTEELPQRFSLQEKEQFEKGWQQLVKEIENHLHLDPHSKQGKDLGRRVMEWVDAVYSKKHAKLRNAVWEKGFKGGQAADEHGLSAESVAWLDQALDAYHRERILKVLDQVGQVDEVTLQTLWRDLMADMFGDDEASKRQIAEIGIVDPSVSTAAKAWLKRLIK